MLEWNIFVKPVVYVMELIFSAVVTIGTADRLLIPPESVKPGTSFTTTRNGGLICALNTEHNTLGSCISVIILGGLALFILLYALWKRLVSAFDSEVSFANAAEAQLCVTAALLWLVIASVLSSATSLTEKDLRGEKIVAVVFSWLLVVLCSASATFAWLIPENDENILHPEPSPAAMSVSDSSLQHPQVSELQLPQAQALPPRSPIAAAASSDAQLKTLMYNDEQIESPRLTRKDAARVSADNPDTDTINQKLSQWERIIDGPPPVDLHATALGAARFVPVANLHRTSSATTPATATESAQVGPSSAGLRRRLAVVHEDEITPNLDVVDNPSDKFN